MKVDIKNVEVTKGMLRKKTFPAVKVKVDFSEEEKAVIKQNDWDKMVLVERGVPADQKPEAFASFGEDFHYLNVWKISNGEGDIYAFKNTGQAQMYIDEVKESLVQLKGVLEGSQSEAEDESFEL